MRAVRLRTEYLKDPIGIDIPHPRLFWNCEGGVRQTAYQIVAEADSGDGWDSGKVQSSYMTHIPYGGTLASRMRVTWIVRLWDENGAEGEWSEPAVFEMGLLEPTDWKARWITGDYKVDKNQRYPVDCFRRTFPAKGIVKARLYAAACGVYEGMLNGKRIGDFVLAPGHTDYTKRIQYQTYDVLPLLKDGENELTFFLADGWYRGSCGAWGLRNQYGMETKLLAQMELTDTEGRKTTLRTGSSWQWSNDGPIRFADNQDGEVFNANCTPSYSSRVKITSCPVVPTASNNVPIASFETAVKEGKPDTVMCSYNKINGIHASDNCWLLTEVLRKEWGFDGMVVTDWGALNDRIKGFRAGCNLNMPGGSRFMEKAALEAVKQGDLSEKDIDASVERILRLAFQASEREHGKKPFEKGTHDALACKIAEQGSVLLKNDSGLLPADSADMVLVGHMAKEFRYQGSGSSHINPTKLTSLTDALPDVPYVSCCDADGKVTNQSLRQAADLVRGARIAVVVAGLPDSYESEGFDRESMAIPEGHNHMIEVVSAVNPNTVVVLLGGSPMELPWYDKVKAILYMGLPGQAGGKACANLLTGKVNPCGKLTETWPLQYADVISKDTFGKRNAEYRESIYVGYRYYDKAHKTVRCPFGHGLSYTAFSYSDLQIEGRTVSAVITNTGDRAGAEVVQLYVAPPAGGLHRPEKELKGFSRVELQPGESKRVEFALDDRSFAVWSDGWEVPSGRYEVLIASSSRDIRLKGNIEVTGENLPVPAWQAGSWYETLQGAPSRQEWEKVMGHPIPQILEPQKGQFTLDNTCMEMKDSSLVMKIQYKVTEGIIAKSFGGKKDYSDPAFKMMMICATDCPLRATVISAGGSVTDQLAQGLLEMANGHIIRGIRAMLKK